MKTLQIFANVNGVNPLVAPVPNKKIRVLRWDLSFSDLITATFQSSVSATPVAGPYFGTAFTFLCTTQGPEQHFAGTSPLFETPPGEGLSLLLDLSAATQLYQQIAVGGSLVYDEVT